MEVADRKRKATDTLSQLPGIAPPRWHDMGDVRRFLSIADAVVVEHRLRAVRDRLEDFAASLRPELGDLDTAPLIEDVLGAIAKRDIGQYLALIQRVEGSRRIKDKARRRDSLMASLRCAVPSLASDLAESFDDPVWDLRFPHLSRAWEWAKADAWLRTVDSPGRYEALLSELDSCRRDIRNILKELATEKAWAHCITRMTQTERAHLVEWSQAIRDLGAGTGKYAAVHRRAARENLERCRSAIPAWIMPIYRIAQTIPPEPNIFDVVIIDEASQAGPESLFLQYLAKKIIVVGDDQQIRPENVGRNREDVQRLIGSHLDGIPQPNSFSLERSYYDRAAIRYEMIRLQEHFRCVPEIIQFSNSLCYGNRPLIPLRQYGADRLLPAVQAIHVSDGYIKGQGQAAFDPPEADAVAEKIKECCEDPQYAEKTMGFISLRGNNQAREVEQRLLQSIGPEEMESRQILCGDAYSFQGDERDVMFLSMVVAPQDGIALRALMADTYKMRFNVAASRARDQMWLFHSVTLDDLSPRCLRHRLLQYCQDPRVEPLVLEDEAHESLAEAAQNPHQRRGTPPQPFESWFEVDVFLWLVRHGYRVTPQYEIHGYRIDLVVEGMEGRLAVECDGDSFHGPDRYDADMQRQRDLERCGWTFWRVRGSEFYRAPDAAMTRLFSRLQELDILPAGRETDDEPVSEEEVAGQTESSGDEGKPEDESDAIAFQQYIAWTNRDLPDPRESPVADVVAGLAEIIASEGPMLCMRAYHLYAKSAGIARVGKQVRAALDKAVARAIRDGRVDSHDEWEDSDAAYHVVRTKGTPAVVKRPKGEREFSEIPPSEIAEVMRGILAGSQVSDDEQLFRLVLDHYEVRRMTRGIKRSLEWAKAKFASR